MVIFVCPIHKHFKLENYQHFNVLIQEGTPPWTVPSPTEKGEGLGVGLAPPPCKKPNTTETFTTNKTTTSVLEEVGPGLPGCMKCCDQSQKEATMPTTLLLTRKNLNIGTWNVRTMYEAGKTRYTQVLQNSMDPVRTTTTNNRRDYTILRT